MTSIVVARVFRRGVFLVIGRKNLASEEASYKAKKFPNWISFGNLSVATAIFGGSVKRAFLIYLILFFAIAFPARAGAQDAPSNDEFAPLVLVRIIPMPDVEGRFDHMAVEIEAAGSSPRFMEMTRCKFWMFSEANEFTSLRIPDSAGRKWSRTFLSPTGSWFQTKAMVHAEFLMPIRTNRSTPLNIPRMRISSATTPSPNASSSDTVTRQRAPSA